MIHSFIRLLQRSRSPHTMPALLVRASGVPHPIAAAPRPVTPVAKVRDGKRKEGHSFRRSLRIFSHTSTTQGARAAAAFGLALTLSMLPFRPGELREGGGMRSA